MARSKKNFNRGGYRGGKSYTLANQRISNATVTDPEKSENSPPSVAPFSAYQNIADTSFSTAVSVEKTISSTSRSPAVGSPPCFVMNKNYQQIAASSADSNSHLVEIPVDFEKELEKKTEEVSKLFDTLAMEQEQRLATEEMQNEMMCWMGDKWKAAEEGKKKLEEENRRLKQDKKEVEMELAEKDRLVDELQEMINNQSSPATTSPSWRQMIDEEKKACFDAAKQYDAAFSEAMNMVEKHQVELNLSQHRVRKLTMDKDTLHHAIKHWLAITNKLVDNMATLKEQADSEEADKMEQMLMAMADEMDKQDIFMEDL